MPAHKQFSVPEWRKSSLKIVGAIAFLFILPNQGFGPYNGINPYQIWFFVLLISAISLVGYVAVRILGSQHGLLVTGFFGGLASSTAVTLSFARIDKKHSGYTSTLAAAVILAAGTMFPRILLEVSIVNNQLLDRLMEPLLVMMVISYAGVIWLVKNPDLETIQTRELPINNPFRVAPALQFGLLLVVVILATEWTLNHFDNSGLLLVAGLSGITDVDAITLSLSKLSLTSLDHDTASTAILIAAATNTLVKGAMVWFIAGNRMALLVLMVFSLALAGGLTTLLW